MTILVTGATGNIGRHVVDRLVGAGQQVRAMTREPGAARLAAGVEVVAGDFERPETWPAVLAGVTRVYLFPFAERGFVEAAVAAGVRRFVVHSAAAAGFTPDPAPRTALARHLEEERQGHRDVELLVESTGEWTHVRPGLLAANALGWAPRIQAGGVVREPYGRSGYPWVHEADVAEIAVAALLTDAHLGTAYTITGPEKVSQIDQVRAIAAATGTDVRFEEVTPEQALAQWVEEGLPAPDAQWLLELMADAVTGPGALPPTDTFERITGRPPRTFQQWAADHAADFMAAGAQDDRDQPRTPAAAAPGDPVAASWSAAT